MSKKEQEHTEEPFLPPFIPYFEWQAFATTAFTSLLIFLAFFIAFVSMAKKMGNKLRQAMTVLLEQDDTQRKQLTKLVDREIQDTINRVQVYSNCDRVVLLQFHNGEYYKSGHSRERVSISNEALKDKGISSIEAELQDIPKPHFKREINLLNRYKVLFLDREKERIFVGSDQQELNIQWRNHLLNMGVVFAYDISIVANSEIVGILSIQYAHSDQEIVKNFERNYDLIMDSVAQIEAVLAGS